jgi:hypothetical protein
MKTLIMVLFIFLAASPVFGQKKSKGDTKDAQIDSLTRVSKNLTLQLDSANAELIKYVSVYNTIKEKVFHYNFDPTKLSFLIDSLRAFNDSTSTLLSVMPKSGASADSIILLIKENTMLKATIDSMQIAWEKNRVSLSSEEIERSKAISSLKQLKELLDAKIITEAEFLAKKLKYLDKL